MNPILRSFLMKKINTKNYCAFVYESSIDRLGIVYPNCSIFYNWSDETFEFTKDGFGDSRCHKINKIEIMEDFSQISFVAETGRKQEHFLIYKSYELNVVLNKLINNIKLNGFSKSPKDSNDITIFFNKDYIETIKIFKYDTKGYMVDGFTVTSNPNNKWWIKPQIDEPLVEVDMINFEMMGESIICSSGYKRFICKIDSQEFIINTLQEIISSISA